MSVYDYQREDPQRYVNTRTWSKASHFFPGVTEHQQKQYGTFFLRLISLHIIVMATFFQTLDTKTT